MLFICTTSIIAHNVNQLIIHAKKLNRQDLWNGPLKMSSPLHGLRYNNDDSGNTYFCSHF